MKNYLLDKESYQNVLLAWRKQSSHSPSQHIIYNLLRSFNARRGFTQITNKNKLSNGSSPWLGYEEAYEFAKRMLAIPVQSRYDTDEYFNRRVSQRVEYFKDFGVDITDDLATKLLAALEASKNEQ